MKTEKIQKLCSSETKKSMSLKNRKNKKLEIQDRDRGIWHKYKEIQFE